VGEDGAATRDVAAGEAVGRGVVGGEPVGDGAAVAIEGQGDGTAGGLLASPEAKRGLAAVVVGALLIAFSPILVRLSELEPTATGFHRAFLALPLLAVWSTVERRRRASAGAVDQEIGRAGLWLAGLAGLFFAADLAAWHWSLAYTTVANSTFLANLAPLPVTLLAWLFFRERPTALFLLGMVVAIAGASLMVKGGLSLNKEHLRGDVLALATAGFYACYIVTVKGVRRRLSTSRLMLYSTAVTSVALLVASLAAGEALLPTTLRGLLILVALAWVSQVVGQGLIASGLAHVPAGFSSVSLLLQPTTAVLLAYLLLGEAITWWQVVGGACVLLGIVLARSGSRRT
jgi:drug/metabolite transporter (DMT)-like permease